MTKSEVCAMIEEVGIIPAIRLSTREHARYAAQAVYRAGIPIAQITMTVPGAVDLISYLAKSSPTMIVGAGTVLDAENAQRCVDAGARFLTSTGLVPEVVEVALKNGVTVFPGALTPTEILAAWKLGADFVKVFPCRPVGGHAYIRALKVPFPQVRLIASGGVDQLTAADFIRAGAAALGLGGELIPSEALDRRREDQIQELARRFLTIVREVRAGQARVS
jgi:2-dehydro-3-deoxyphosphogluconate aldolase/(4S)-4-hydroxy-2-oxoglutarate aldolase